MTSAKRDSDLPPPEPGGERRSAIPPAGKPAPDLPADKPIPPANSADSAGFWLNGEVLACACPECGAPMTVRLWLLVADCWRCDTSIELTEEQEAAARRLLERQSLAGKPAAIAPRNPTHTPAPTKPTTPAASSTRPRVPASPAAAKPRPAEAPRAADPKTSPSAKAAPPPARREARPEPLAAPPVVRPKPKRGWIDACLGQAPAWLISSTIHLIAFILLALSTMPQPDDSRSITLSTRISADMVEGNDPTETDLEPNEMEFEAPLIIPLDGRPREVAIQANREARQLRLEPGASKNLPKVSAVKRLLESDSPQERVFAARDPRLRDEILEHEGGTIWTEAAVARGLYWLSQHQNDDGSWSLTNFADHPNCQGRCSAQGHIRGRMAATSLALLPFLGAGQAPHVPCKYRDVVARALAWLVAQQNERTGDLRGDADNAVGMYVHGQATIVLCEALSLTGDAKLREPAKKAIDFIERAQHQAGGWRYTPGQEGDTSVHGWQVMALYSGKTAGVGPPEYVFRLADQFLDVVASRQRVGLYGYRRRERETPAMTAEGLLCRFYLGGKIDDPGVREGIDYLVNENPPSADRADIYYWYYGTQVMHHRGGDAWKKWNRALADALLPEQITRGHEAGSWNPKTNYDQRAGRLYVTALATCTLEVYYRHTPIFREIKLD